MLQADDEARRELEALEQEAKLQEENAYHACLEEQEIKKLEFGTGGQSLVRNLRMNAAVRASRLGLYSDPVPFPIHIVAQFIDFIFSPKSESHFQQFYNPQYRVHVLI